MRFEHREPQHKLPVVNQTVVGSGDNDTFVANTGFGQDTITNFNAATDVIQFNYALFASCSAVIGAGAISQVGAKTVITFDQNNTVTLTNVAANSLVEQLPFIRRERHQIQTEVALVVWFLSGYFDRRGND